MANNNPPDQNLNDPPPPILGGWKKLYAFVFMNLVILVILFYIFTRVFE